MRVKIATGLLDRALRTLGIAAVTMPWRTVYVVAEFRWHAGLLRHEAVHLEQMHQDGAWYFTLMYLYFLVTLGYLENPYERQAYELEPIVAHVVEDNELRDEVE